MASKVLSHFKTILQKLYTSEDKQAAMESDVLDLTFVLFRDQHDVPDEIDSLVRITGAKFPVILAHSPITSLQRVEASKGSETNSITTQKKSSRQSKSSSVGSDHQSVCGSPLKLEIIDADLSAFEGEDPEGSGVVGRVGQTRPAIIQRGISLSKARHVMSVFSNLPNDRKVRGAGDGGLEPPSILIPCDGKHIKSLACTAIQYLMDDQNNRIGVKITEVSIQPAVGKSSHMKFQPEFVGRDVVCQARYDLGQSLQTQVTNSRLQLDVEWSKQRSPGLRLLHNPPSDARSVVRVGVESGNPCSTAFSVYQELQVVKSIVTGLATTQVHWVGLADVPLVQAVQELIEQLSSGTEEVKYLADDGNESDLCVAFDSLLLEERKDFDFTDHLWKVLQKCSFYADLVEALKLVMKVLRKGELQPFISRCNTTTMAQMVKDSYTGQLRMPSLTGLQPLQYLAEMGIQKLSQDFIHVFLHKNLATHGQLEFFMSSGLELPERLERLERLQNTLEVVIVLQQLLNMPHTVISDCSCQMLKHYEKYGVRDEHQFEFLVPTGALSAILETYQPSEWQMEGQRLLRGHAEKTRYLLAQAQPFDWIKTKDDVNQTGVEDVDTTFYLSVIRDDVCLLI